MNQAPIKKNSQDDYIKTSLRLPPDLHAKLTASAEYAGHSLNAEILACLRSASATELMHTLLRENAEMKLMLKELLDLSDRI